MSVCFPDPGLPDPQTIGTVRGAGSWILGHEIFSFGIFGTPMD
jgi:hypothetical protein